MDDDTYILLISNPQEEHSYRVNVPESRREKFEALMQSNGFKFQKTGSHKQMCISVDLTKMSREEK